MALVKAVFKSVPKNVKNTFKDSHCLVTVSVGQQTHEGDKFVAAINLIANSIASFIISLYDSLQRYTIALNHSQDARYYQQQAVKLGDEWIKRNEPFYKNAPGFKKIIRWDDWLNDADFAEKKGLVVKTMQEDADYQATFQQSIDDYLTRYIKRLPNSAVFDMARSQSLCLDYIIEECAVVTLWPKTECQFELYSGKHNAAIEASRNRFVRPFYPDRIHPISMAFNPRPNLKPQKLYFSEMDQVNQLLRA